MKLLQFSLDAVVVGPNMNLDRSPGHTGTSQVFAEDSDTRNLVDTRQLNCPPGRFIFTVRGDCDTCVFISINSASRMEVVHC